MLDPGEGTVLGEAIRAAYGDSYDAAWVYDAEEVGRRLADGTYVSCVAEGPGRRAALPRRARSPQPRRPRRAFGAGGDDAGRARPAPVHGDQATADRVGAGRRAGGHVRGGDRRPPLQRARQHRARRARDRLPARLDPRDGLQQRRQGRGGKAPVGGALLHQDQRRARAPGLRPRASPRDRRADPALLPAAGLDRRPARRRLAGAADRAPRRGPRGPQPGLAHRAAPRRRPRGSGLGAAHGDVRGRARRDLPRHADGDAGDGPGRRSPRGASGSSTPASSPTPAPTATSCACSR